MGSKTKKKIEKKNVIIQIPLDIENKYKEMAEKQGLPKSHMYLVALNFYLEYKDAMNSLPSLVLAYKEEIDKRK